MKPQINSTSFGSIQVNQEKFDHDIFIDLSGEVKKRKKKLSKKVHGTSHILSEEEAKFIYQKGMTRLIVGSGQYGALSLSGEAEKFFQKKECSVTILPTPAVIKIWNETEGEVVGLFHVTC